MSSRSPWGWACSSSASTSRSRQRPSPSCSGRYLGISSSEVLLTAVAGVVVLVAVGFLYRPLLFASLDEDVAEAKGVPMLFLGTAFLLVVAVAVSFAVQYAPGFFPSSH